MTNETQYKRITFCCGPSNKLPVWTDPNGGPNVVFKDAILSRGVRSPKVQERIRETYKLLKDVLEIPSDYSIMFVNGSGMGAIEAGFLSLFGSRPLQTLSFGVFSKLWSMDIESIFNVYRAKYGIDLKFEQIKCPLDDISNGGIGKYEAHIDNEKDLIVTYTDTSIGFHWNNNELFRKREESDGLIFADITTAAFTEDIPWDAFDFSCISFQKNLGAEAGIGCIVMSPKAMQRILNVEQVLVSPLVFKLNAESMHWLDMGEPINSMSMVHVEEIKYNLTWAKENGGLKFLQERSKASQKALVDLVEKNLDKLEFVIKNKDCRARSVLTLRPKNPAFQNWDFISKVVELADEKYHVDGMMGLREEIPLWRFWTGPTVENAHEGFSRWLLAFDEVAASFK